MPHFSVSCRERQLRCGSQHEAQPSSSNRDELRYQLLLTKSLREYFNRDFLLCECIVGMGNVTTSWPQSDDGR